MYSWSSLWAEQKKKPGPAQENPNQAMHMTDPKPFPATMAVGMLLAPSSIHFHLQRNPVQSSITCLFIVYYHQHAISNSAYRLPSVVAETRITYGTREGSMDMDHITIHIGLV